MKLPLAKGNQQKFIAKRQCPVCKCGGLHEPNSFAFVSLGALDQSGEAFLPQHWGAFFSIGWHGAHSDMGGKGERPDTRGIVNIVDDFSGGADRTVFLFDKLLACIYE